MNINILHNYRESGGLDVVFEGGKTIKVMVIRHNLSNNLIVSQIQGYGRLILWEGDDATSHASDTEEQLIEQIKTKIIL